MTQPPGRLLTAFTKRTRGVVSALVVAPEQGPTATSDGLATATAQRVGAVALTLAEAAQDTVAPLEAGELQHVRVGYRSGVMVVTALPAPSLLVVLVSSEADLPTVQRGIDTLANQLRTLLDGTPLISGP